MNTIFVSAFTDISTVSNNRMFTIFNKVEGDKHVVTSDFNHRQKKYRTYKETQHISQILLHVPSYKKNLSLARIWSHIKFAKQVKMYLSSLDENPDVIYCTMPTSSSAYVCAKFCKKNGIKYVIDVIDLWPDSLLPLVKGKTLIKELLYPWTYLTRYAYRHADVIMGESVTYANEAKKYNDHAKVYPIYLGVDMQSVNKVKADNPVSLQKPEDEIWIAYAGSLGVSYDFEELLDAVNSIHGKYRYKLWFIGDGVRHREIEQYIKENCLKADITGFLPYNQLLGYLLYCDIAINIFRKNSKVVYSYKFNDYVATNCFVMNSLEGETSQMVNEYRIGRNFDFDKNPLSHVLEDTLSHWDIYSTWKKNTTQLIDERLDKNKIYAVVKEIFNGENYV